MTPPGTVAPGSATTTITTPGMIARYDSVSSCSGDTKTAAWVIFGGRFRIAAAMAAGEAAPGTGEPGPVTRDEGAPVSDELFTGDDGVPDAVVAAEVPRVGVRATGPSAAGIEVFDVVVVFGPPEDDVVAADRPVPVTGSLAAPGVDRLPGAPGRRGLEAVAGPLFGCFAVRSADVVRAPASIGATGPVVAVAEVFGAVMEGIELFGTGLLTPGPLPGTGAVGVGRTDPARGVVVSGKGADVVLVVGTPVAPVTTRDGDVFAVEVFALDVFGAAVFDAAATGEFDVGRSVAGPFETGASAVDPPVGVAVTDLFVPGPLAPGLLAPAVFGTDVFVPSMFPAIGAVRGSSPPDLSVTVAVVGTFTTGAADTDGLPMAWEPAGFSAVGVPDPATVLDAGTVVVVGTPDPNGFVDVVPATMTSVDPPVELAELLTVLSAMLRVSSSDCAGPSRSFVPERLPATELAAVLALTLLRRLSVSLPASLSVSLPESTGFGAC
ncbi:hypothetical protein Kisp02_23100 [Kineosporia sp. NBRC 101731]|nr:hypothetical protein Kisp02_23100 [Kineosporia sp. NBRC 101731]